jgi:transposase InsO family protein
MNNIITQTNKNKRYLPHDFNTRKYAIEMYMNCNDINYVCRKYHISRISLWRWLKRYDGTKESLSDRSHKPKSHHPNAHTNQEIRWIRNYVRRNPRITLNELWRKLKCEKGYTRTITALYRVMKRLNIKFYKGMNVKNTSKKKHNKKYETPKNVGEKGQMDVKYVPNECKAITIPEDKKYYQYTYIDEATRERYLYWYEEHTPTNTIDFVKRVIQYFGYIPKEIQTDNGTEFTYNKANIKKEHPLEVFLKKLGIKHHKIKPRTPQHNGKVERSHRNDNERFYSYLKFFSLEDLRNQGKNYLKRSNNIPMAVLNYLTPKEKRNELEVFGMVGYIN